MLSIGTFAFKITENGSGTISYERFLRLNEPETAEGKREAFDWLETSYQYDLKNGSIKGRFDGDLRYFINDKQTSISLAEANLSYTTSNKVKHTVGRQKLDWHPNEKFWQLGHFQGLRNFRLTDRKQEGLIGYHLKINHSVFKPEFFLSYVYLPNLNPTVDIENGIVTSNSDWYRRPPSQVILRGDGSPSDITYKLNEPSYNDIIMQKTLGARLSINWKPSTEPSLGKGNISTYIIYKPETSIRVNAQAKLNANNYTVPVNVDATVNHHFIYGATIEQEIGISKNRAGITYIDPTARLGKDFDSLSIEIDEVAVQLPDGGYLIDPKYNRETYLHFSTELPGDILSLNINGIHYLTKHDRGNAEIYGDTVRWISALGIGSTYNMTDYLSASINLRYDLKRKDNLFDGSITIRPFQNAFIKLGLELIRSPNKYSYWSSYRANDTGYINFGMAL